MLKLLMLSMVSAMLLVAAPSAMAQKANPTDRLGPTGAAVTSDAPSFAGSVEATAAGNADQASTARGTLIQYTTPVSPTNLLQDPNGGVWFTSFVTSTIGYLDPGTGALRAYELGQPKSLFAIARDGNGGIWYTTANAPGGADAAGRLNPQTGLVNEWVLPRNHFGLDVAPNGQEVWFVSKGTSADHLARLRPQTNELTRWNLNPYTDTYDLDLAPNGDVWFTVQPRGLQGFGVLSPGTGQATIWTMPAANSRPFRILAASDTEVWLTEFGSAGNSISRFNPTSKRLARYALPLAGSGPAGLLRNGAGVWFTEFNRGRLGVLAPNQGSPAEIVLQATTFTAPATSSTVTPSVVIPAIRKSTSAVTTHELTGVRNGPFIHFALPAADSLPLGLAPGNSGVIWLATSSAPYVSAFRLPSIFLPAVTK